MCKTSQYVTSEGQNYVRVKKKKKSTALKSCRACVHVVLENQKTHQERHNGNKSVQAKGRRG